MYGVITEKRNRIVEILLSSGSAFELLMGKLLGFAARGLIQIAIWLAVGLTVAVRFLDFREIPLGFAELAPSLLFFLGGYILFSAMFAALGATMKDAEGGSQAQGLVVLVPMIPLRIECDYYPQTPSGCGNELSPAVYPRDMLLRLGLGHPSLVEIALRCRPAALRRLLHLPGGGFSRGILQFDRLLPSRKSGAC